MADGFRLPGAGYTYSQHNQHHFRHLARNETPPSAVRSIFSTDTPSPARSPDPNSPAQNLYGMFGQGHQPAQHGRVNGGPGGRGMMMYNFPHQNTHQQQQHTQHHQALQQDHSSHSATGPVLGHHTTYSSGVISNATPNFTPQNLPNGHAGTTRGGQAQQINEHWAEQLKLHKEAERAHSSMNEGQGHHFARIKAHENNFAKETRSGLDSGPSGDKYSTTTNGAQDGETEDRGRPSNVEREMRRQDWNMIDMSGQGLRVLSTSVFDYTFLHELYISSNKITHLPVAIGKLRHLRHLDASNNQISDLPPELGMCVYLKQLLLFDNNIRTLPNELGSLYQLEMLGIEGNPLQADMKQVVMERGTKALIHHLREQAPGKSLKPSRYLPCLQLKVPLPPAARVMLDLQEGAPTTNQERLRISSYNILCHKYATSQLYGYTPAGALSWDYRKEQILSEIESHEADIICLQEVDTDNFKEFFSVKLAHGLYKGVFWPKSRAKTMSEKDAKAVDGCATFYNGRKYILLDKQLVDFANIAINRPDMKNQHDIFNRVMPRDNLAVITFFENRFTGARFIIVNTHLGWDPMFADVKIIQTAILVESITKLAEKYARWPACTEKDKKTYGLVDETNGTDGDATPEYAPSMEYTSSTQLPLIIAGDFNSTYDSGVYELLAHGRIGPDHSELGSYQYGNFTRDGIQHPFSLRSSYAHLNDTPEQLPFTNYTPGYTAVIDYIWYSTNALEVASLLGPVDAEYMKRVPGFPNYHFPSDHLSILAEFIVKGRKEKKTHPEPDFGPQRDRRN
jgi:CCR4-NOT transcription complex subunit 6